MAAPYTSLKFAIRAVIGNITIKDITSFVHVFERNTIPFAQIGLAAGQEVHSLQAASINQLYNTFRRQMPVTVYLQVIQQDASPGASDNWPTGEFVVWDGRAVGINWNKTRGAIGFSMQMTHWLDDLNNSSAVSGSSHPLNPADFTFAAVSNVQGPMNEQAAGGQEGGWTPMAGPPVDIDNLALANDFWMKILQPWMVQVANYDAIDTQKAGGGGTVRGGNKAALRALARMTDKAGGGTYVPLAMDIDDEEGSTVADAVVTSLRAETYRSWANTSLWGKLVGDWAPNYLFAVIPRVSDALIVPYTGALQKSYLTITANDSWSGRLDGTMPHVLKAVGIYAGVQTTAGGGTNPAEYPITYNRIAGKFPKDWGGDDDTVEDAGVIMLKAPPPWLANVTLYDAYAVQTSGAESEKPVSNALSPGTGEEPPEEAGDPADNAANVIERLGMLDRYAHQWFVMEMLRARSGEITGKLRFDIAPGSNVAFEAGSAVNLPGEDQLAQLFYGNVMRVTTLIEADTGRAGTTFNLDNIRTTAENADPSEQTSVKRPPLYQKPWYGAALIDSFQTPQQVAQDTSGQNEDEADVGDGENA